MPFITIPGINGRVYAPEKKEAAIKKHNCNDCFSCRMCSDTRCSQCLKEKSCARKKIIMKKETNMELSQEEILRYSRHLIMPEVGVKGQEKMRAAKVLIIGAGGLGTPNVLYLAAAGIGDIGIIDFDVVEHSNLQRQVIHGVKDVGKLKVESAKETIGEINPNVRVITHKESFNKDVAMDIIKDYDLVVDGTDNFQTRYLTNDACVFLKKPNIYASIFRFEGQATVFQPGNAESPCYRCLYPEPPPPGEIPSCAEGGVLGILPGLVGLIQSTEVVKIIIGQGKPLVGRLLLFNALEMSFRTMRIRRDSKCPVCGPNPTIRELVDYEQFCGIRGDEGQGDYQDVPEITVKELFDKYNRKEKFVVLDVREPQEYEISSLPDSKLIPLGDVAKRANELDTADEIMVLCKVGIRSAKAIKILQQMGFRKLRNIRGGIIQWALEIDQSVPRY